MSEHPLDKLVTLSDGEDRDQWLAARAVPDLLTATQISAVAGSNPYTKLIDVYNEKTDPNYDREYLRNIYLEERAELGNQRESEIIEWATQDPRSGGPGAPFTPNKRLVASKKRPGLACTPDGAKLVGRKLVLIECKTTQTRWDQKGIPQHILDQMYIQIHVTGAVTCWLAAEFYEWSGKGANKTATLVGTMLEPIQQHPERLEFLLAKKAEFDHWVADGIAPESDVFLEDAPEVDFDDSPDEAAEKIAQAAEAARIDAALTELAEIEARIAADVKREKTIKADLKKAVGQYDGRRVHLVGKRMIAQLVRFNSEKKDTSMLDEKTLRSITTWPESERLTVVANPDYVAPVEGELAE